MNSNNYFPCVFFLGGGQWLIGPGLHYGSWVLQELTTCLRPGCAQAQACRGWVHTIGLLAIRRERAFTSGVGDVLEPGIWEIFTFFGGGNVLELVLRERCRGSPFSLWKHPFHPRHLWVLKTWSMAVCLTYFSVYDLFCYFSHLSHEALWSHWVWDTSRATAQSRGCTMPQPPPSPPVLSSPLPQL